MSSLSAAPCQTATRQVHARHTPHATCHTHLCNAVVVVHDAQQHQRVHNNAGWRHGWLTLRSDGSVCPLRSPACTGDALATGAGRSLRQVQRKALTLRCSHQRTRQDTRAPFTAQHGRRSQQGDRRRRRVTRHRLIGVTLLHQQQGEKHDQSEPERAAAARRQAAVAYCFFATMLSSAAHSLLAETMMASSMATAALGAAPALRSRCVHST